MSIEFVYRGFIPYLAMRKVQEERVIGCAKGESAEAIYFCSHQPVITVGKSESLGAVAENAGCQLYVVTRGGKITYHGPTQLMIYPVVNLSKRGLGVKKFVEMGLSTIADYLQEHFHCEAVATVCPPGVWVDSASLADGCPSRKIAFVGLKITRGVTDHGFALNIHTQSCCFQGFVPCGDSLMLATSLYDPSSDTRLAGGYFHIAQQICARLRVALGD